MFLSLGLILLHGLKGIKMSSPWEEGFVLDGMTQAAPVEKDVSEWKPWSKEEPTNKRVSSGKIVKKEAPPVEDTDDKFENVFSNLIKKESAGKHFDEGGGLTTSPVGAQGVTQVMPKTGRDPGYGVEPLKDNTKEEFLRFGRDYLKAMLKKFNGDYEKALAAYNAGPGNVDKAVKKGGDSWKDHLPKKEETLPYIKFILGDGDA
jgi:hypothetical protein